MEWLHELHPAIPVERLETLCTLAALPALCVDVYSVEPGHSPEHAEISCVWGVFATRRSLIRNGVRYELLSCPNALQWTVTTRNAVTTLHGSINQSEVDPDFATSLADFIDHFRTGLLAAAALPQDS